MSRYLGVLLMQGILLVLHLCVWDMIVSLCKLNDLSYCPLSSLPSHSTTFTLSHRFTPQPWGLPPPVHAPSPPPILTSWPSVLHPCLLLHLFRSRSVPRRQITVVPSWRRPSVGWSCSCLAYLSAWRRRRRARPSWPTTERGWRQRTAASDGTWRNWRVLWLPPRETNR